jgi:hypothetical protein
MKRAPFLTNPYGGYRMDGVRRHDQSWADLSPRAGALDAEVRAMGGIVTAALLGAVAWALLGGVMIILWGLMS